jgi:NAD(P)-dependent dehydrogenase (short-subunit alcohol dehydrogenase family)
VHSAGRNPGVLTEVEGYLRAVSTSFRLERCDVTDEASVRCFLGSLDRVDIMVNSVGIGDFAPLVATEMCRLRDILELNVVAAFVLMREAARDMLITVVV